jgi:uncharacterized membrane protein
MKIINGCNDALIALSQALVRLGFFKIIFLASVTQKE